MNHRIFERTLRPLVFQGACLFERHFSLKPSGLVLSDTLSQTRCLLEKYWQERCNTAHSTINVLGLSIIEVLETVCSGPALQKQTMFDLKSGRTTR